MTTLPVVVAEDSLEDFELIRLALERDAPAVEIAHFEYGDAALRFLTDPAEARPALVLLDLNLPVSDGFEVMEGLRRGRVSAPPVVVLTTSGRQRDRDRAADLGASEYLVKPMDFEDFVDRVAAAKRRWIPTA